MSNNEKLKKVLEMSNTYYDGFDLIKPQRVFIKICFDNVEVAADWLYVTKPEFELWSKLDIITHNEDLDITVSMYTELEYNRIFGGK